MSSEQDVEYLLIQGKSKDKKKMKKKVKKDFEKKQKKKNKKKKNKNKNKNKDNKDKKNKDNAFNKFYETDILQTVGATPLVKLRRMSPQANVEIWLKIEFMNPSGSVKDRIVKHIIEDAEKKGLLKPGGMIVENTSGNTGAAVAMQAAAKGYKAILTMPDKVSKEKQDALKAYGAEIVVCPTSAPPGDPEHYEIVCERIHKENPGSFKINQYDNKKNPEAHYLTTGPEIWAQMGGKIDYFVASGSTGGTITGIGTYLKEQDKNIKVVLPDPVGSIYYEYQKTGKTPEDPQGCTYNVEGIGEDHVCEAIDFGIIDDALQFTDDLVFAAARRLAREEGILAGGSAGANIWGALEVAKTIPADKPGITRIVTVAPDSGVKYLSKMYDDVWMKEKGLL